MSIYLVKRKVFTEELSPCVSHRAGHLTSVCASRLTFPILPITHDPRNAHLALPLPTFLGTVTLNPLHGSRASSGPTHSGPARPAHARVRTVTLHPSTPTKAPFIFLS